MLKKTLFLASNSGKQTVMKQIILFLICFTITIISHSQQSRKEYISKYQLLAIEEMGRSGIPASIKMAQACLESANGKSELARKSNNHFGIKCKRIWRGQKVYYDDDHKNECFRKYNSVEESYIDHSNFLMGNTRYAFLFTLAPDDYKGWAKGLKQAGYATARHYDKRLIEIIEENKLYRLDRKESFSPLTVYEQKQISNKGVTNRMTINPYKSHKIITINSLDAVVARQGDTFEVIAQELGMKPWEIYKFNDRPEVYVPQADEVIYIESKKRKAPRQHLTHVVGEGETMHYISQLYGIRLKPLLRRNRLDTGEEPGLGKVVYLRKRKPAN